jgi:hypothetical protein
MKRCVSWCVAIMGAWVPAVVHAHAQFVPGSVRVSRAVQSALDAPSLRDEERRDLGDGLPGTRR